MNTREMQDEILRLKEENDICILVHAYESHDIWEVADFMGDSYGLSLKAAEAPQKTIIMCGVRFMAETVKILSPDKKVILANPLAGCAMADQLDVPKLSALKEQYPGYTVVAYINTTSELKTICDVCVTSSSAPKIIGNLDAKDILFVPDQNLGSWIAKKIPDKNIQLIDGCCPVHACSITAEAATEAKALHPDALLLVHPESLPEVSAQADYAGSTTGIMDFAKKSGAKEFIIGTENSIVQHLQFECPDKKFYPLSKNCVCDDMRLTTLADVYQCCLGIAGEEIVLSDDVMTKARKCIDTMIELG